MFKMVVGCGGRFRVVVMEGGVWLWSKVDDGCGGRWRVVVVEGG